MMSAEMKNLCRSAGAAVVVRSMRVLKIVAVVQFMTPQKKAAAVAQFMTPHTKAAKTSKSYESDMWPERRIALRVCKDASTPT